MDHFEISHLKQMIDLWTKYDNLNAFLREKKIFSSQCLIKVQFLRDLN